MKKVQLVTVLLFIASFGFAQNEKYTKKMEGLIAQFDTSRTSDQFTTLSNSFERIGSAEKTQWLPFYYASLAKVNSGMYQIQGKQGDNSAIADPIADQADELMGKALKLTKETSETWILKKMIAQIRMMANPMQRYMKYGTLAAEALKTAKKLDPNNPRVYLLEAEDKFFTPPQFGGNKEDAMKLFTKAQDLYKTFKPENKLSPNWGLSTAKYFLSQAEKKSK